MPFKHQEMNHRNAEAANKKLFIHNSRLPAEFCSKLTPAAVKEVNRQLTKAWKWVDDNINFKHQSGSLSINSKECIIEE